MKYLLDVNALVALAFVDHVLHERVRRWVQSLSSTDELATCAITELGFVRILSRAPQYGFEVKEAVAALWRLKKSGKVSFSFVADDQDASQLPSWVSTPKQITDGHLAQLARVHHAMIATLDRGIPGAFLIPGG
jgi:toxin-antitoxin system PIN domain toxin